MMEVECLMTKNKTILLQSSGYANIPVKLKYQEKGVETLCHFTSFKIKMRLLLGCKMVQQKDTQNKRHDILQDYSAGCSSFDALRQIYNRNVAKTSNKL